MLHHFKSFMIKQDKFGVQSIRHIDEEMMVVLYLQVSVISQALTFLTRSRSWSFLERPGLLLVTAFFIAQLVAPLIAVYANCKLAKIKGCGWGRAGVVWLYTIIFYFPLDIMKFAIHYILSGKAWNSLIDNKTSFTTKKDYGKKRGKLNRHLLRELYMDFNHQKPQISLMNRTATGCNLANK